MDAGVATLLPGAGDADVRAELARFPAWPREDGAGGARFADVAPIVKEPELVWVSPKLKVLYLVASPVAVVAYDATFASLDVATGVVLKKGKSSPPKEVGAMLPPASVPLLDGDALVVPGESAVERHDLSTGKKAKVAAGGGGAALAPGLVALRRDGALAIEHADGMWTFAPEGELLDPREVRLAGDLVLVPSKTAKGPALVALARTTGKERWRVAGWGAAPDWGIDAECSWLMQTTGSLLADEAGVVVHDGAGRFRLLDAAGKTRFDGPAGLVPRVLTPDTVVCSATAPTGTRVVALDRATGKERATLATFTRGVTCAVARDVAYLGGKVEGRATPIIVAVDLQGHELWRAMPKAVDSRFLSLVPAHGRLYALTPAGRVLCLAGPVAEQKADEEVAAAPSKAKKKTKPAAQPSPTTGASWEHRAGGAGSAFALPIDGLRGPPQLMFETKPAEGRRELAVNAQALVASGGYEATVHDPETGEPRFKLTTARDAEVRLAGDVLLVGGDAHPGTGTKKLKLLGVAALTAFDVAKGDVLYRVPAPDVPRWVALAPGLVAVATGDVLAVHEHEDPHAAPGAAWTHRLPAGRFFTRSQGYVGLRAGGGLLFAATSDEDGAAVEVVALDRKTGEPRWSVPGWKPETFGSCNTADSTFMADDDGLLVHGPERAWTLYDLAGRPRHVDTSGRYVPQALAPGFVLAHTIPADPTDYDAPTTVVTLDRKTGAARHELITLDHTGGYAVTKDLVYVTGRQASSSKTILVAFDGAKERFRVELLLGIGWINNVAPRPGRLHAISKTGRVYGWSDAP